MNKFIKKTTTKKTVKKATVKKEAPVKVEETVEVIKKGDKEFVICPKCGWKHTPDTKRCRFCGAKIGE